MIKLYLITGFLGAGKTTFLKKFVTLFQGQKLALIVNEFGKEGVDGALLSTLGIALSEINNGSIFVPAGWTSLRKCLKTQYSKSLTSFL